MLPQSPLFLRRVLLLDAVSAGGLGLLALLFAAPAAEWLNLPQSLLTQAGLVLLPFAAFVAWLGTREIPSRTGVWIVIGLNALWVIESILLLVGDAIQPTMLGQILLIGQAVAVGAFAELEYLGLRKVRALTA